MKISTYNIRVQCIDDFGIKNWRNRKAGIKKIIETNNVDVIGVQEIANHIHLWSLEALLPAYDIVSYGRNSTKGFWGERLGILYKKATCRLLDQGVYFLSNTPNVASSSWGNNPNRICVWAKFLEIYTGKVFYIFNTHFDGGDLFQNNASNLVVSKVNSILASDPNANIAVLGDFNIRYTENRECYRILANALSDSNLNSTTIVNGHIGTGCSFTNEIPALFRRIDYIFTKNIAQHKCETVTTLHNGIFPSDHLPMILTCEL